MRFGLALLLLSLSVGSTQAAALTPDVKQWTLENGLKVLFGADHKAPVVTVQVFYHVGGKDEPADKRGIAHMFEHMMFKGSRHVRPEEHARFIDAVGGNENAFTQDDLTGYYDTIPPEALDFTLQLEAERMRGLELTQKTIDSEREVVKEELRMRLENNPVMQAVDRVLHLAYTVHPYRQFPIGEKKMLDTVTVADCKAFYDLYYRPNNASVIVIGDTDEETVHKLVEAHFGKLPRGAEPPRNHLVEPPQTELREAKLNLPVQLPVMVGAYHIPGGADEDLFTLDVIQQILTAGESSRLYRRLVKDEQLAVAAGGIVFEHEDPGLFVTYAAYLPNKDAAKIRQVLDEETRKLVSSAVDAKELQKAKNQLAARAVYVRERVSDIASQMGEAAIISGSPLHVFTAPAKYDAVTPGDVMRVAKKYFNDHNYSVVTLIPQGGAR